LYGCEAWSVTLREEQRLRVFENRVLRKIFGPMRDDEVRGKLGRLHNELLYDMHSPNQIKKNMGRACGTYGEQERRIQRFGRKTRGKETTWKTQA
jgi:hypothetical protein